MEKCFHGRRNGDCPWCARKIEYAKELAALDPKMAAKDAKRRRRKALLFSVAKDIVWPFGLV